MKKKKGLSVYAEELPYAEDPPLFPGEIAEVDFWSADPDEVIEDCIDFTGFG